MDETKRCIAAFRARPTSSVRAKLDASLDLERLRDPRLVPFLLEVLADRQEPTAVRIHVLKRLRNGDLLPGYRPAIAEALLRVLVDRASPDLRPQAALALAQFTDIDGVPTTLGGPGARFGRADRPALLGVHVARARQTHHRVRQATSAALDGRTCSVVPREVS